jgi:hypothetical protein
MMMMMRMMMILMLLMIKREIIHKVKTDNAKKVLQSMYDISCDETRENCLI